MVMSQHKNHVRDWMTTNPMTVTPDTSVMTAFAIMRQRGVRRLPVISPGGHLIGIVTRSDVQRAAPYFEDDGDRTDAMFSLVGMSVHELMTPEPIYVAPDDTIRRAAQQMIARRVSGLPVVSDGQVVGIITESDIFRLIVESWELEDGEE